MAEMPAITLVNLTERKLFAAMALQGLCADHHALADTPAEIARIAVEQADALIAELAK